MNEKLEIVGIQVQLTEEKKRNEIASSHLYIHIIGQEMKLDLGTQSFM